ncbi:MAG: type II secretion system protein [Candidatus Pacebacteria bacterium]|nr:type II secretion system protein [Candidatus Paceibacterota bacterium]
MSVVTVVRTKGTRGFTLIELLVVIAIIGILSAVILPSLNAARSKGVDSSVRSNLSIINAQAALYFDVNSKYATADISGTAGSCATASSMYADQRISAAIAGATSAVTGAIEGTHYRCTALSGADGKWAISSRLTTGAFWCVDSTGMGKQTASLQALSTYACL